MKKILNIIIPVFNEEKTIEKVIKKVAEAPCLDFEKRIYVIDDGSYDRTVEILNKLKNKFDFVLLKHQKNLGKGAAIKTALGKIEEGLVLVQDADLEYVPDDWPNLLKEIGDPETTVVFGKRKFSFRLFRQRGHLHFFLGGKFLSFLISLLFLRKVSDAYTCYKLFDVSLLKDASLKSRKFEIEAEMTINFLKKGLKIKEVPIQYFPRRVKEGKKIKPLDGLVGIWTIIKMSLFG